MLDFGCVDVGFWLYGRWILLCGRWILVVWTLDFVWVDVRFCCVDVGFWFVLTSDFRYMDAGFWLGGC